jgi:SMC interacting uncharacterized protein involved in chromosome segregation
MRELDAAKDTVSLWTKLHQQLQDLSAHLELAEEAKDENEEKEVSKELEKLERELIDLELRALLSR